MYVHNLLKTICKNKCSSTADYTRNTLKQIAIKDT